MRRRWSRYVGKQVRIRESNGKVRLMGRREGGKGSCKVRLAGW